MLNMDFWKLSVQIAGGLLLSEVVRMLVSAGMQAWK